MAYNEIKRSLSSTADSYNQEAIACHITASLPNIKYKFTQLVCVPIAMRLRDVGRDAYVVEELLKTGRG
jgi:hypothetical protein